jgi:hypothetical protein
MSATLPTRRALLAASAAAGAVSLLPALVDPAGDAVAQPSNQGDSQMATKADAIRPFSINFPEEALVDLRRRINATKWPERETVGRFIGAGVNFGLAAAVAAMGTLGTPVALTAAAFAVGLLVIPVAPETRGATLPE